MRKVLLVLTVALSLVGAACSSGAGSGDAFLAGAGGASASSAALPWHIQPGVNTLTVTETRPGEPITLYDDAGTRLVTVKADRYGQVSFPYVPTHYLVQQAGPKSQLPTTDGAPIRPGTYYLHDDSASPALVSGPVEVTAIDDVPPPSLYAKQHLKGVTLGVLGDLKPGESVDDGFQYIEMRDGVKLSAMIRFPDPALYGPPPYPTVVETSGYGVSNPNAEQPGAQIFRSFGFATVSVNMRGTGCSGGVFDVFNPAQQADGYDIIEAVARQPWVLHHHVGMVGLSYSGITQLYTAATRPPHLAAITAQSVIADPWLEQWPGGVYNGGFTRQWLAERDAESSPGGVDWVAQRVDQGDTTCAAHQRLRNINIDFEAFGKALVHRPESANDRDLRKLVRKITAPTFVSGAFQDEQTGPYFTGMLDHFDNAKVFKAAMWNGRHPDGYSPMNLMRVYEFLEFYVAERVPHLNSLVRAAGPAVFAENFKVKDVVLEPDRWYDRYGDDYQAALKAYQAEDPIRVVFENGVGQNELGEPGGTFEQSFSSWPTAKARTRTWYLGADGALTDGKPTAAGADSFAYDPAAGAQDFFGPAGYELLAPLWDFDWTQFPDGRSLSYVTQPLPSDLVLGGPGEVDLKIAANATDADIQVTLSEVRPDGVEYELQNGLLRLGDRKVDAAATKGLRVEHTFAPDDYQPLSPDRFVTARIALPSVAAPVRAGSRLRLTISTPGRNFGAWTFENPTFGTAKPVYTVRHTPAQASAVKLSVLPGVTVPAGNPPCPSLRGQACRTYVPTTNLPAAVGG